MLFIFAIAQNGDLQYIAFLKYEDTRVKILEDDALDEGTGRIGAQFCERYTFCFPPNSYLNCECEVGLRK